MDDYKRELRRTIVDDVPPKYAKKKQDDSPQKNEASLVAGVGNPQAHPVLHSSYLGK